MKQRVRVVGLIKDGDGVLIMKRNQGRSDSAPLWELPTGKIKFGEQPEEAIDRTLEEYLGVEVTERTKLSDVVTFLAPQGASQLSNLYIIYEVTFSDGTKVRPKDRYTGYKYIKPDDMGNYRLDEASATVLAVEGHVPARMSEWAETNDLNAKCLAGFRGVANSATVYVDGCSRGNPGPAGIGYYIVGENGQVLKKGGEFIGFATSRVAEYYALKEGCEQAIALGLKTARFVSDNLMLVNQMNGIYKLKNQDIVTIYDDVQKLLEQFEACAFLHVAREQNREADAEANKAVDRQFTR